MDERMPMSTRFVQPAGVPLTKRKRLMAEAHTLPRRFASSSRIDVLAAS